MPTKLFYRKKIFPDPEVIPHLFYNIHYMPNTDNANVDINSISAEYLYYS